MKRVITSLIKISAATLGLLLVGMFFSAKAYAFDAGNIISDAKFTNSGSMNEVDIQNFLNSKNSVCLTGYQTPEPLGSNNYGGNVSAARAIWKAGQLFGINPQVLLVTLQKEQGFITRGDCPDWRYRTAMGFGCPDGSPCDAQWYGLSKQLYQAARHFRGYYDQNAGWYIPYTPGVRYIPYNPNGGCGGSNVNIVNRATASLYSYTPYQPNAAALNNLYGLGDGCSAYGNRNFWRDMNAWFPDITVMTSPDNTRLYINEGGRSKRWIPSMDVFNAWGLGSFAHVDVTADTFNSIPEKTYITRLMSYPGGPIYMMDNGEKHGIPSINMLTLWGFTIANVGIVDSTTLASLPVGRNANRFIKSTDSNDGRVWLADVGLKHYVSTPQILSDWGFNNDQDITYISPALLGSKSDGADASTQINVWGTRYVVSEGRQMQLPSAELTRTWGYDGATPTPMNIDPLNFLSSMGAAKTLAQAVGDGRVYFIEGGKKHYIGDFDNLVNFGYQSLLSISFVTPAMINSLASSSSINSPIVNEIETGNVYALDGRKNYIPSADILAGWLAGGVNIESYSKDSLSQLPSGVTLSPLTQSYGDNAIYVLNKGTKHYIADPDTLNAWGYPRLFNISFINKSLGNKFNTVPTNIWQYVDDGTDKYLLNDGYYHKVSPSMASLWSLSNPVAVDPSTINRLSAGNDLKRYVKFGANYYLADHRLLAPIGDFSDAYGASDNNTTTMSRRYYPNKPGNGIFIQSTDSNDGRVWLINRGEKVYINTPDKLFMLGYGSLGLQIIRLTPELIAEIPTSSGAINPLVIRKNNDYASKLLVGNGFLSFSNWDTLAAWSGINEENMLIVSDSIYNLYPFRGIASRLVNGPDGKVYYMENGTKRWITSYATYLQSYANNTLLYLPGYMVNLVPTGSNIP